MLSDWVKDRSAKTISQFLSLLFRNVGKESISLQAVNVSLTDNVGMTAQLRFRIHRDGAICCHVLHVPAMLFSAETQVHKGRYKYSTCINEHTHNNH